MSTVEALQRTTTTPEPVPASESVSDGRTTQRKDERIGKVSAQFEEMFLRMLLKKMMPRDASFFGKDTGAEVYKDLFVGAVAEEMSNQGVLGIKGIIEKQLGALSKEQLDRDLESLNTERALRAPDLRASTLGIGLDRPLALLDERI